MSLLGLLQRFNFRGGVAGIILGCMFGVFLIVAAAVGIKWYLAKRKERQQQNS